MRGQMHRAVTVLAAPALFGCGALGCLAYLNGLYASGLVAVTASAWITLEMLWRQDRRLPDVGMPRRGPLPAGPDAEAGRRRLQALLDQTPVPLLTVAADDGMRAANRAARQLFATDDRIRPQPALKAAIARAAPGERTVLRLPGAGADRRERSYALSVASSVGPDGAVRLAVLTDIEAELQAAEAAALRDLLQVLSHEIMNSLTPVTSLADTAQALLAGGRAEDLAGVAEALEAIGRRAGGLDRFVRGYRLLARLPPPALRPNSVGTLLRHVATLFRSQWPGVALALTLPEPDIVARIDPDQLAQALLNLLGNAAEAAMANDRRPAQVGLDAVAQGSGLQLCVTDSGLGIPPGQEEMIFRPFFTSKPDGTGIGLGLARQIVRSHGGDVVLEPQLVGQGAIFLLTL